jgi:hypothetical protein
MVVPQYEEWRLSFVLPPGDVKTGVLMERLRERLPPGVDAHRKGRRCIRLYAQSRELIADAEKIALEVLSAAGLRCPLEQTRWNPADERWQSPLLPVEPPRRPLPDEWSGLDEAAWEVRLRFPHAWEAAQLLTKLLERDAAAICNGKRVTIGVADERTARQRVGELRLAAPTATIEVRPLSRWRIWLLRQKLLGNYADGSSGGYMDGGDWGGDGGGDGGF